MATSHGRFHPPSALLAVWLLLASVYALSTGGHTYSPDEEAILLTTRAGLHGRTNIAVDSTNDLVTVHRMVDGKPVGVYGIGTSILAVPGYMLGKGLALATPGSADEQVTRLGALWTNALVAATTAVVLVLLCEALGASRRGAVLLALAYGLGTMAWPAAKTLFSEPPTALFTTVAVLGAVRGVREAKSAPVGWSGFAIGAAVLCRASAALFLVPLGIYLLVAGRPGPAGMRRRISVFVAGGALPLLLFAVTNWLRFGSPFDAGYEEVTQNGSLVQGLIGQFFSPGKSIFLYAPVAAIAAIATRPAAQKRPAETALLWSIVLANTIFFARAPFWSGDNAWGPRYTGIVLPCLIAVAAPVVDRVTWRRAASIAAVAGALVPGLLGTLLFFNTYFVNVNAEVGREPVEWAGGQAEFLVSTWWYPRWQPFVGHASLLPMAARETLGARRADDPVPQPFPETMNRRFNWYDWPPRIDLWPFWLGPTHMPRWLALLVLPLLAGTIVAARSLLSWWRATPIDHATHVLSSAS